MSTKYFNIPVLTISSLYRTIKEMVYLLDIWLTRLVMRAWLNGEQRSINRSTAYEFETQLELQHGLMETRESFSLIAMSGVQ